MQTYMEFKYLALTFSPNHIYRFNSVSLMQLIKIISFIDIKYGLVILR